MSVQIGSSTMLFFPYVNVLLFSLYKQTHIVMFYIYRELDGNTYCSSYTLLESLHLELRFCTPLLPSVLISSNMKYC